MYVVTSMLLVRRTRATFRSAELGFLGVVVYTRVQTPRRNGFACSAGAFSFLMTSRRARRTSWLIVGIPSRSRRCPRPDPGETDSHNTGEVSQRQGVAPPCGTSP